jgi:hypothetical protein
VTINLFFGDKATAATQSHLFRRKFWRASAPCIFSIVKNVTQFRRVRPVSLRQGSAALFQLFSTEKIFLHSTFPETREAQKNTAAHKFSQTYLYNVEIAGALAGHKMTAWFITADPSLMYPRVKSSQHAARSCAAEYALPAPIPRFSTKVGCRSGGMSQLACERWFWSPGERA